MTTAGSLKNSWASRIVRVRVIIPCSQYAKLNLNRYQRHSHAYGILELVFLNVWRDISRLFTINKLLEKDL